MRTLLLRRTLSHPFHGRQRTVAEAVGAEVGREAAGAEGRERREAAGAEAEAGPRQRMRGQGRGRHRWRGGGGVVLRQ